MGRAKIAMQFIKKDKTRNTTYAKRKKGLLKKSHEFSILCNVPICIIMFPYKEEKQSLDEVEVYSFKGDDETVEFYHIESSKGRDPKIAMEIIGRYLRVPKDERNKRATNLYDMLDEWTRKANQELCKLRHNNALAKYASWGNCAHFDGVGLDQLMEILVHLDQKIECVKQRISMVTKRGNNNNNVMPYFEPTPISSLMIPEFEIVNQFPLFNYPLINNNNQEFCHQIVPFNHQQNAFIDRIGTSSRMMMNDHLHDYGGNSNNNLFMYNMNMRYDVTNAMYYDQGLGIADNVETTSSNGDGLPMNMPVMQNNVSLPWQRQYHQQMFYK